MVIPHDANKEFNALRGYAIQCYAALEQSLCAMFAHLAEISDLVAGVIFFKMVNARSRVATLERLKRLKHGTAYNLYFNSIMDEAGRLDGIRNKVIHWHPIGSVTGREDGSTSSKLILAQPNFWEFDEQSETITEEGLKEFALRCDLFARGLNVLRFHWSGFEAPSLDIFEQPLRYPLPESHPLNRSPEAQLFPPESSQA